MLNRQPINHEERLVFSKRPSLAAVATDDGQPLVTSEIDDSLRHIIAGRASVIERMRHASVFVLSRLVDRAIDAGVNGAITTRLESARFALPMIVRERLEREQRRIACQNRHRLQNALRFIEQLEARQIRYVLLKGAALIAGGAVEMRDRPMTDVDILIHANDAEAAETIIKQLGGRAGADLVQDDFYPRFHYEREYLLGTPPIKIDLHVRAFRPTLFAMRTPVEAFWRDSESYELMGGWVRVPNPTVMLIHLAVHAACHGGTHMRWLNDIYQWLLQHHTRIASGDVAEKARAWRLVAPLRLAMHNTKTCFDVEDLINPYMRALRGPLDPLARITLAQAPRALERPATDALINVLGVPGWRGKSAYLRAVGLPHESHLREHYQGNHAGWQWIAHARRVAKRLKLIRAA